MSQSIAYPIDAILMIGIPVCLGLYLKRRFDLPWSLWWIGAATFVISQIGHIPFNAGLTALFNLGLLPSPPQNWNIFFNAAILGLSAGLWEELARYAVYSWWVKDARSWRKAVWLGAGHGGIEAILLGALVFVNFVYLMAMRNVDLAGRVSPEQLAVATSQIAAYWSAPWSLILMGALERLLTQPIQIALSIFVLQALIRNRPYWLLVAVLWHAVVNAAAVYTMQSFGPYVAEAVIGVASIFSLVAIFALRHPGPAQIKPIPQEVIHPPDIDQVIRSTSIETPEKLEQTKYQ